DSNGFRNAAVRPQVDVVAIGDSQTWGVNVQSADAWPQQVERLTGRPIYNMSVGGYGPVQYWRLTDKAFGLSPKVIVVGLYFGNDLYDAYALTYANDKYADLRGPGSNADLKVDTVRARSTSFWDEEKNFHNSYGRHSISGLSFWLREHSAIGRLLNRSGFWPGATDVDYEIDKAWAEAYPNHGTFCDAPNIRTVFTTAYRLTALDLNEPRISEGLRISKLALGRIKEQVGGAKLKLVVLLIPTKESVYAEVMTRQGKSNGAYAQLVTMEQQARQEIQSWCTAQQVNCVDALPDMQKAIAEQIPIYPSTTESHPNAAGYRIMARKVIDEMEH
ncbi:MAG TPA: SGNH/GDSL hydrolase family protein, partial [Pyrinomonadaceae bacterium]|nr:SGNH/GDSL hydrolase family protein [Pyrinomonadaceae bacterium]